MRLLVALDDKLHIIPCGAPVEEFQLTNSTTVRKTCHFLSVARFVPVKGPLFTLRAFEHCFRENADIRLTMVGDGPLLKRAKAFVEKRGIDEAVVLPGQRTIDEVREHMADSDVFVQHSITDRIGAVEGWGVSLAEAASSGLPIVATNHGGIPDQVIDKNTGFLVPEGDWWAMAERMLMLAKDSKLRQSMG